MKQQDFSKADQELVSDLVDGRLRGAEFARGVEIAGSDGAGREAWQIYHFIGDAMRSQELTGWGAKAAFAERVLSRLEQEAVEVVSMATQVRQMEAVAGNSRRHAANRSAWTVAAVGLGSLAVAAAVVWLIGGNWVAGDGGGQLAQTEPAVAPVTVKSGQAETPVMIRDARLDELMAAHKQAGGATALQQPAMFLRNAAFDEGSR